MGYENVREILRRKRTLEILELLSDVGERNFTQIESEIESSSETISSSLSLLEENGLVERREVSRKDVRYEITDSGAEFLDQVRAIQSLLSTTE